MNLMTIGKHLIQFLTERTDILARYLNNLVKKAEEIDE